MGASSGIGRETALRFARKGAKVVVSARSKEGLDSLVEEIRGEGGSATAAPADTSEFGQVWAVADRAVEEHGRLDTWVHLAAVAGTFDCPARQITTSARRRPCARIYGGVSTHWGCLVPVQSPFVGWSRV
jgi:NAD(P)-dependent dehydrogenase (short-subunit alcohol dehydrogenase family)